MSIKDKIVEEDEQISKEKLSASKSSDGSMNLTSRFPKSLGTTFEISRHDSNEQKCGDYFASASNDKSRMEIMPGEKELFCDRPQEDLLFKMPLLPLHQRESSKLVHTFYKCNILTVKIVDIYKNFGICWLANVTSKIRIFNC